MIYIFFGYNLRFLLEMFYCQKYMHILGVNLTSLERTMCKEKFTVKRSENASLDFSLVQYDCCCGC